MTISEKIFSILQQQDMTMGRFARLTGISRSTISDWKTKGTNPASDKIMVICQVLGTTPEELLSDTDTFGDGDNTIPRSVDMKLLDDYHSLSDEQQHRLQVYLARLKRTSY